MGDLLRGVAFLSSNYDFIFSLLTQASALQSKIEMHGIKRRTENFSEVKRKNLIDKQHDITSETSTSRPKFPLLELPVSIICDILSRLPLKDILHCRCVCKMFLNLLKDPYFTKVHLTRAPTLTTNLILQENVGKWGALHFFTFDLDESTLSFCSSDDQNIKNKSRFYFRQGVRALSKLDAEFSFRTQRLTLVGSCNGLLCLYFDLPSKPFYGICNPILCESMKLPSITVSSTRPSYNYSNHSSFGYCPRTKQYKVISFMYLTSSIDSKRAVALIHTVGSDSWRRIGNAPFPKRASFDPFLNGSLHWITNRSKPSELISSFDLEKEKFSWVPPPPHFRTDYINKLSWINTGVLNDCLCICYTYEDSEFEVWVMSEYGVGESWRKEFSIDMKFYCRLHVEDFHRPIKFMSNGDLWFISSCDFLVCFSPRKRTFRELRSMGPWMTEINAHILSFVSIRDVVGVNSRKVKNFRLERPRFIFGV